MVSWVVYTLIAAFFGAIVGIVDKFVVSKELRDAKLCATIYGFIFTVFAIIIAFALEIEISFDFTSALAIFGGAFLIVATIFYYDSLVEGDVSNVLALFLLGPLFVVILSSFFLKETFGLLQYIGIFFLMIGTAIISFKKTKTQHKGAKFLLFTFITVFLFACRDVTIRYATLKYDMLMLLFWAGIGAFLTSLFILVAHHPHIMSKLKEKGIHHLIINSLFSFTAFFLTVKAISMTKVALVSTLVNVKVFLVLIITFIFSKYQSKMIKEDVEKSTIILKIIGILFLFIGSAIIIFNEA